MGLFSVAHTSPAEDIGIGYVGVKSSCFGSSWAVYTPCWAVQKYFPFEVLGGAAPGKTWNGVGADSV